MVLALAILALTQAQIQNQKTTLVEIPVRPASPPNLSLRRALTLAQLQTKKRRIPIHKYYLSEAKYTLLNFEGHSFACWRLLWTRIDDVVSPQLEAYVFMNGKVRFSP